MGGLGLMFRRRAIQAHPTISEGGYILSPERGDQEVLRVLLANGVSSDGYGISKEDAAAVTSIGTWFNGNEKIVNFDELKYFINVTELGLNAFANCTNLVSIDLRNVRSMLGNVFSNCASLAINVVMQYLQSVTSNNQFSGSGIESVSDLGQLNSLSNYMFSNCRSLKYAECPASITQISTNVFNGCSSLQYLIFYSESVPTLFSQNALANTNNCPIYVPDGLVDAYKSTSPWSVHASRIKPISEKI